MNDTMEMDDKAYFGIPALSKSQIKNWNVHDPMAFWLQSAFNPMKSSEEFGDYVVTGKLYHMMLLQRELVDTFFEVNDDLGKSRINKKWQAAQAESKKLLISSEELDRAKKMVIACQRQELIKDLLSGGVVEAPYVWHDEAWGIDCKMRLDLIKNTTEGIYCIDYKTTSLDVPAYIDKNNFQYDVGFYSRGIRAKYGHLKLDNGEPMKMAKFIFIFQSTKEGEENMVRPMVVEGPQIEACEIDTDTVVKQIVPRLNAWKEADSVVCAEVEPEAYAAQVAAKEDAKLKCWLPEIELETWEVSPWFDRKIAENIHKGE